MKEIVRSLRTNGRLPVQMCRSLAPKRTDEPRSSFIAAPSALSSNVPTDSKANMGGGPASAFFRGMATMSSTRSSAATKGSCCGAPALPFTEATPQSFSRASWSTTMSSSTIFWAKSSMPGLPPSIALTLTHSLRVKRPCSMPRRTNQRRSAFISVGWVRIMLRRGGLPSENPMAKTAPPSRSAAIFDLFLSGFYANTPRIRTWRKLLFAKRASGVASPPGIRTLPAQPGS